MQVLFTADHLDRVAAYEALEGDARWSRSQFEKELTLPMSRFYVVFEDQEIAGYGGFWIVGDEAQMTNLLIRVESRRQGMGENLLRRLLRQAGQEGCARMTLEVRAGNEAAQALYRKAGF